ncbi:HAMP domain-containing sensor histidine kinase [Variovorax sp. PCZ-1]|uniref:sensor histidine kinase n=1 Tax=Variovorax sp. PCZ-1 TaxID=2835533 RepID=UPI001BCE3087|nr:HAMP domain-containing sensor histidine kinase [Variovorax sp. PCZ-1]MBS7807105.1 HAMP domain-containing histidine kinase [Variovorax sp. PCZ-1]
MYSLLPALVSGLFIAFGFYVLAAKGLSRVTASFFLFCTTTFFWHSSWAVLYTVSDAAIADSIIRFGYLMIVFLPTTMYHFSAEICSQRSEQPWIYCSYGLAAVLAAFVPFGNLFVDGHYTYFWGYYPKAGALHVVHVLQTAVLALRVFVIAYQRYKTAPLAQRNKWRIFLAAALLYMPAAVDYLCNYGVEFYPPGVVFIAINLCLMSYVVIRHDLLSPFAAAATIAHELRTPLATIRMQASHAAAQLPHLMHELQQSQTQQARLGASNANEAGMASHRALETMCEKIVQQVDRTNKVIDLILASARMEHIDTSEFKPQSMMVCVQEAVDGYPLLPSERKKLHVTVKQDFSFLGSQALMIFVLSNMIKNSLYAMKAAEKGELYIQVEHEAQTGLLTVTDTASGIPKAVIKRIFDTYYSTKQSAGAGVGLAFCQRVIKACGGQIRCDSVEGEYTTFTVSIPTTALSLPSPDRPESLSTT